MVRVVVVVVVVIVVGTVVVGVKTFKKEALEGIFPG